MPSFARLGNDLYAGRRSFEFIGRRRVWYAVAAVAMLISVVALGVRGLNPSIDFKGGSEFDIARPASSSELLAGPAVDSVAAGAQVRVSKLGGGNLRIQTDKLTSAQTDAATAKLAVAYGVPTSDITVNFVGPSWGSSVTSKAVQSLVVFLILVAAVIAFYFRTWTMAFAAIVALIHDLLLTVGIYALVGFEVSPASVIGFLTILGYSLYDTVVVFDKVRENTDHLMASTKSTFAEAANLAVNQTLVRSINTSVVALLPVGSILFIGSLLLGAGTLKDISLALFVGIAAGTYSSIFIATPLLVQLREREPEIRAQAERVRKRREAAPGSESGTLQPVGVAVVSGASALSGAGVGTATELRPGTGGQRPQPRKAPVRGRSSGRKR